MTGLLTTVLHERAATAPRPDVDLDAIIVAGDRRVRRGRTMGVLAAAAVAGVVGASALVVPGLLTSDGDLTAGPAGEFAARRVSFASGQRILWGGDTFELGRRVASYVQTDDGFVYTTPDERVWLFDGVGSDPLGNAENGRLRADDTGSLASWVELAEDGHPQYVVFDTSTRTEVARVDDDAAGASVEPTDQGAEVFAVDDGSAYWRHGDEFVRYDVATKAETVIATFRPPEDPSTRAGTRPLRVMDVAQGRIAWVVDGAQGGGMTVGHRPDSEVLTTATNGYLSPDGRYLGAEEDDNIAIYDTDSRQDVTPDLGRYPFAVSYSWVDADTAMVFAVTDLSGGGDSYDAEFLSCDVPTGSCDVVTSARVGTQSFSLPIGERMDS